MATTLKPRNGLVVVQVLEAKEEKLESGIILPKGKTVGFNLARVLAVGPGVWDAGKQCATDDLKVGQMVLIKGSVVTGPSAMGTAQYGDTFPSFEIGGGKVGLVNQMDILAVVEDVKETLKIAE